MRTGYALSVLVAAAALWTLSTVRPARNLVIITLDTTRVDRLSPYGLMDQPMPALERLAREGTVFDAAITVSPLTLPAHASLFTGLLPPRHGIRDNADRPLAHSHVTLAEVLSAEGFLTAGFVGSTVLDAQRGLAQGFETYEGVGKAAEHGAPRLQRRADSVIDDALAWLRTVENEKFFLWTHLYDPHLPYDPPDEFAGAPELYTGEIAFAAAQIRRLLDALDSRGVLDQTIVVVVGDHGESLGEHGEPDHGVFLYDGVIRVPLMIRVPGRQAGRVRGVVRLTDVMPTVLDLLHLPAPASDGVSLARTIGGSHVDLNLEAYSESLYPLRFGWSGIHALRGSRFKFIDAPDPELYDLATDPLETRNIVGERPALAAAMRARLRALAVPGNAAAADVNVQVSSDLRERLAALGYAAGGRPAQAVRSGGLPDPKECMPPAAPGRIRRPECGPDRRLEGLTFSSPDASFGGH